ncbi:hypothetical protein ACLBXP_25580, partial [Methylobacterium sp. A54F]
FIMGLKLVSEAIQEFQEQAVLPFSSGGVPAIVANIGLNNGTWEAIGAQGVLVLIALACLGTWWLGGRGKAADPKVDGKVDGKYAAAKPARVG